MTGRTYISDSVNGEVLAVAADRSTAMAFINLNKLRIEDADRSGFWVTPGTVQTMDEYGGVDASWLTPMPQVNIWH